MEAQTAKTTSRSHLAMRYCAIASHRHPAPNILAESGALVLPDQLDKVLVRVRLLSNCAPTAILSCSWRVDFVLFDAPRAHKTSRATANIPKLSSYGPSGTVQIPPSARDPPELPAWEPTWSEMEAYLEREFACFDHEIRGSAPRSYAVVFILYPPAGVFTGSPAGLFGFYAATDYFPCWPKRPFSGDMAQMEVYRGAYSQSSRDADNYFKLSSPLPPLAGSNLKSTRKGH